jgi:hypothetical protein
METSQAGQAEEMMVTNDTRAREDSNKKVDFFCVRSNMSVMRKAL